MPEAKKSKMQQALTSIVDNYLTKPGARGEVANALGVQEDTLTEKNVVTAIESGAMPAQAYKKIIENHVAKFNQRQERFEKKIWPEAKAAYQKKFLELSTKYNLGLTEEKIAKKLTAVKIKLADAVTSVRDGVLAGHNKYADVITFSETELNSDVTNSEHVISHETTHAVAGRNISLKELEYKDVVSVTRGGFRFRENKSAAVQSDKFFWLNEAVTESFTLEMGFLEAGLQPGYPAERELFNLLIAKAKPPIEIGDFYRAYFEDFEPDQAGGRIPNFRDLMKKINTAYGNGFLGRLDKIVTEKGVEEAVRMMQGGEII